MSKSTADTTTRPATGSDYTRRIQDMDSAHHMHPFTTHHALRRQKPRVIVRGEGVYLWDSEGVKIIDGMAGLWCVQLGYGVTELADVAAETLKTLAYYNTFFQTTTPYAAELAALIASKTPGGLDEIMFASSGSEAVDTAIKSIWYYWNLKNKPHKKAIISRHRAYHGSTLAGASLSGLAHMQGIFDLPLPQFHHIEPTPHYYVYGAAGESEADFAMRAARALEDKIVELGAENVAAFVGEPVMGAGGLMIPPEGYWPEIERICRKYDILLWSDEVICGFGRTGEWFGCQTYGFTPDVMTMAKGLSSGYIPISAVALNGEIAETLVRSDTEMAHGFTYSGHPVACAVAIKTIEMIERLGLVGARGARTAKYFQERLAAFDDHPLVGQTRGVGMLGALELVRDKKTKARFEPAGSAGLICRGHCFETGVIMRAVGDAMILCPPLVIADREIDDLFDRVRRSLDLAAKDLGV